MSGRSLFFIGEVFLLLTGIAGFVFYYLNNLNNKLYEQNQRLRLNLNDEKRHAKGLRVKIQELTEKLTNLTKEFEDYKQQAQAEREQSPEMEQEYQALQSQLLALEKKYNDLKQKNKSSEKQPAESSEILTPSKPEEILENDDLNDYKVLYQDLKAAIAFSLQGGEQVFDRLQLIFNKEADSDTQESLNQLKERYHSLSLLAGPLTNEVDQNTENVAEIQQEIEKINLAQAVIQDASELLKEAEQRENNTSQSIEFLTKDPQIIGRELNEANLMNQRLRGELDRAMTQLAAFINKARTFQAQKEQIKVYKATESQMHRNMMNLNTEIKLVNRQYNALKSRNEILNAQLKMSLESSDKVDQLELVAKELEAKEQAMDRLLIEKNMLEQQFLSLSDEADIEAGSSEALDRLQNEHRLLEQQFMEVLNELSNEKKNVKSQTETE